MERIAAREVSELFELADYRIFNLEIPLTDNATPIKEAGSKLIASTKSVYGLKQISCECDGS